MGEKRTKYMLSDDYFSYIYGDDDMAGVFVGDFSPQYYAGGEWKPSFLFKFADNAVEISKDEFCKNKRAWNIF